MGRHSSALAALREAGKKSKLDPENEAELLLRRQVQALEVIALVVSEAMDFVEFMFLRKAKAKPKKARSKKPRPN